MPVFKNRIDVMVRGLKVFLNVEAGANREGVAPGRTFGWRITRMAQGPASRKDQRPAATSAPEANGAGSEGVKPENMVWIFGAARTGSTWLSRMMGELDGHAVWSEPLVGALFGNLYYDRAKHLIGRPGKHYILGDGYRDSWMGSIRSFVLKEASGRFPEVVGDGRYLVVKEPNGSQGAPLIMEALPESRLILLVRDPRDTIASMMDGRREGGWQYENRNKGAQRTPSAVDRDPDAYVRNQAKNYLDRIIRTKQAYDAHQGPKVLVRYEELRADTMGTMLRIYSELGIPVDRGELEIAIEKNDWENIPEDKKGEGKVFRKATPGGWQDDLTPEQVRIVEKVTAPILEEFYSTSPSEGTRG